jgi:hypothetical protein
MEKRNREPSLDLQHYNVVEHHSQSYAQLAASFGSRVE